MSNVFCIVKNVPLEMPWVPPISVDGKMKENIIFQQGKVTQSRSLCQKLPIDYQFPFSLSSVEKEPYKHPSALKLEIPLPHFLGSSWWAICKVWPMRLSRCVFRTAHKSPCMGELWPFSAISPPAAWTQEQYGSIVDQWESAPRLEQQQDEWQTSIHQSRITIITKP